MAKIHTNENLSDMLTKLILVLKLKKNIKFSWSL